MAVTAPFRFEDVREYAERHDEVLGLVLFGSRGRDLGVDEHSAWEPDVAWLRGEAPFRA